MTRTIEYRRGDIYYIEAGGVCVGSEQKPGRPGVIVSNDLGNKYSSNVEVVFLTSQSKKELPTHVSVICKVPSTALCENIQTVSKERLGTFIRACSDNEMREIDNALLCSLGITIPEVERERESLRSPIISLLPPSRSALQRLSETCTRACTNSF